MNHIVVYQTNAFGFFLYEDKACELLLQPGEFNVPFGAVETPPPEAGAGFIQKLVDGEWTVVEDHRDVDLYVIATGDRYQLGTHVDVDNASVTYDGGGPIPAWLTDVAPAIDEPVQEVQP